MRPPSAILEDTSKADLEKALVKAKSEFEAAKQRLEELEKQNPAPAAEPQQG